MAVKKSMVDVAFEVLSGRKKPMPFQKLFEEVAKKMDLSEDMMKKKKGSFYSALSMDSRFVSMNDNQWDLKSRRKYDEVHMDIENLDDEEVEIEDSGDDFSKQEEEYN